MVQEAALGLWRAGLLDRPWTSLTAVVAKRRMVDWIRRQYGRDGSIQARAPWPVPLEGHDLYGRTMEDPNVDRGFHDAEVRATLAGLPWRRLTAREQLVFELRAGGMRQREIGRQIGVTESRVCQILARASARLTA